jgi:hypothetical protein
LITMSLDGATLFTLFAGQPMFEVLAESEKDSFLKIVDAEFRFERDSKGRLIDLVLHQNGRDQATERTAAAPPPPKEH